MDVIQRNKSRKSLLLVLIAFALPIVLAKFALTYQWIDYGVTNQGQLVEPPLPISGLNLELVNKEKQWLMLLFVPTTCDDFCQQLLTGVNNTYVALGKEMPRVTPVALSSSITNIPMPASSHRADWLIQKSSVEALQKLSPEKLYLVDPLGNVFLSHQLPQHTDNIASFGKAVLADMKKVLKYSKVG